MPHQIQIAADVTAKASAPQREIQALLFYKPDGTYETIEIGGTIDGITIARVFHKFNTANCNTFLVSSDAENFEDSIFAEFSSSCYELIYRTMYTLHMPAELSLEPVKKRGPKPGSKRAPAPVVSGGLPPGVASVNKFKAPSLENIRNNWSNDELKDTGWIELRKTTEGKAGNKAQADKWYKTIMQRISQVKKDRQLS